jgi:signal transduction histidine kinase
VVDLTKSRFKLYHSQIYLLDEQTGWLILAAGSGEVGKAAAASKQVLPLDSNAAIAQAARDRRGVIIPDVRLQAGYKHYLCLPDTLSELAVPMIAGEQVAGAFSVLADVPDRFYPDDLRTFTTLASQAAVALCNAELYAEQMETVERLRELDQLKSAFLANMSHELRTPLNSILGFAQVITEGLDGPLTEDMVNDLNLIEKNGRHLLNLINDVLDMAKIEAGRLSLDFETFDLGELVQDVLDTAAPLARNRSLDLQFEMDPTVNLKLRADRFRIRQILLNLVGNAIKFTEEGGVTVRATRQEGVVRLGIQDTGIGIPPEKLEAIFEAFSQVDTSTTRKAGGTGLGLPISRRLVEMHGGRLWAKSRGVAGEGTLFWLELPIEGSQAND